jgi:small subunit ribosomal protein S20
LAVKKSSAEKRHRQSEERRLRNKSVKSSVRTGVKRFVAAVQKKDQAEAEVSLKDMIQLIEPPRKGLRDEECRLTEKVPDAAALQRVCGGPLTFSIVCSTKGRCRSCND